MKDSSPTLILAVDPGLHGALVYGSDPAEPTVLSFNGEVTALDAQQWAKLKTLSVEAWTEGHNVSPWMERPVKFRGATNRTTTATATVYGQSCGALEMALFLTTLEHPSMVEPHKWQRSLGLGQRGTRTQDQWKRHLRDAAREMFPNLRVTLSNADALLIYAYAHQTISPKRTGNRRVLEKTGL